MIVADEWGERVSRADQFDRKLDELREVVADRAQQWVEVWSSSEYGPEASGLEMQTEWLDELVRRFHRFYPLDPVPFVEMSMRLGGGLMMDSQLPGASGPVPDVDPRVRATAGIPSEEGTANRLLDSAHTDWVQHVDALIRVGDWQGVGAGAFALAFLGPFRTAVDWQREYVQVIRLAARSYYAAINGIWDDLDGIADACIAALRPDRPTASELLNALSFLATAVGTVTSTGPFAIGLGVTSMASSVGATLLSPSDPIPYAIGPYNSMYGPMQIMEQACEAITKLEELVDEFDTRMSSWLSADLENSEALASPNLELARVRDIADEAGLPDLSAAFDTLTPDLAPLYTVVVRDVMDLYRAGYVMLPGAAIRYDQAIEVVASCRIDHDAGTFFPRSKPDFNEVRNNLVRILRNTRSDLEYAGEDLTQAALAYEMTDEDNAERLREERQNQVDQIPPPAGHARLD